MENEVILNENSQMILKTLARHKSMPFMELKSICRIDMDELQQSVGQLVENGLVNVREPNNPLEEIVTLNSKGFAALNFYSRFSRS